MSIRNELKAQIESLTDKQAAVVYGAYLKIREKAPATVDEFPEELLSLCLEEKRELLRKLQENGIPAAERKAAGSRKE